MKKITKKVPSFSNQLQEKFINYLMKDGKKNVARKLFDNCLSIIASKGQKDPYKIFEKAIENTTPLMEVKPKRIGGGIFQIPIEVKASRQLMLSFRWIIKVAKSKKGKSMAEALAEELMQASNNMGDAVKKKEESHKMAEANKALAHLAKF